MIDFDKRDGWIWYDGEMVPWRDAKLHVLSHGLHYASCVFEGQRVYGGTIFRLEQHTERLFDSARQLGFKLPFTVEEINQANYQVCRANTIADGYVRPVAWRGSEMMGVSAQKNTIHVALAAWEWPSYFSPEARLKGLKLQWSKWKRPDPATIPAKAKAAGLYMICTLSKHAAESDGFDDALMLDWRGQLAETTGANVFLVMKGALHTPTPDCFLDGITRKSVIALARARQIPLIERHIAPEEMAGFGECFITGTAAEVTPVSEIGPYRFTPGQITEALMNDYAAEVRSAPQVARRVTASA